MIRIKGGRVIDPASGLDKVSDLYIKGNKIVAASAAKGQKVQVIDAKGKWVVPGLIDMHVHLREPGFEYKETIASGCDAAAAGGFTTIVCMPNTNPTIDNAAVVDFVLRKAEAANGVTVLPMGAVSKGLKGEELAEIGDMQRAGAVAITDDGKGIMSAAIMRAALEYASNFGLTVCAHTEDHHLSDGGHMHEGEMSTRLGLAGIPSAAESVMVSRDLHLAELTGAAYHVQHISTRQSVDLVRQAKKRQVRVTCEVAPHHWTLTDASLSTYDANFKMAPPLRSEEHVKAVRRGLKDGTIDVIATDHAPHAEVDKKVEFGLAANGIIGLETAVPLALDLIRQQVLEPLDLIAKLTVNPAKILGLDLGTLAVGADADVTIIDPEAEWIYTPDQVRSKSLNSPWLNQTLVGRVDLTLAKGKIVHQL